MDKTKKIIMSLGISLVIVLIIFFISNFKSNSEYIKIPVYKNNLLQDTIVTKNDITYINVKSNSIDKDFKSKIIEIKDNDKRRVNRNVYIGEFVINTTLKKEEKEQDKSYKYVSIPISSDSLPLCNNLNFGDKIDVCYTAKLRDVSMAIKNKKRIYSNNLQEGYVTCILFENIDVISKTDSTGKENNSNLVTDVIVKLEEYDAMLVSNLKNLGTMDIITK